MAGHILAYFLEHDRVVGAGKYNRINCRVFLHKPFCLLFDEEISSIAFCFSVFYQWHPHWAGVPYGAIARMKFCNLHVVALALDSAGSPENADMSRCAVFSQAFHRRAYDP